MRSKWMLRCVRCVPRWGRKRNTFIGCLFYVGMTRYKLVHDRPVCIGCGACVAVSPTFWEMSEDGKADIKGSAQKKNEAGEIIEETLDLQDAQMQENLDAAQSCPVNCIHMEDAQEKKKLI